MTHTHEWLFNTLQEHERTTFGFKCRHCPEVLEGAEVLKRLDATEWLSAATAMGASVTVTLERQSKALLAYADVLEGKSQGVVE